MSRVPTLDQVQPWCVYLCRGLEGIVYVGMTCQLQKRITHHRSAHTPLGEWIRASHPHGWLILGEGLSQEAAELLEARTIHRLLAQGQPLLNRDLPIPNAAFPRAVSAYQRRSQ